MTRFSMLGLLGTGRHRPRADRPRRAPAPGNLFRPHLESLEGRVVLSASAAPAALLGPALVGHSASHHQLAPVQMVPIQINSIVAQGNQLVANASLGKTSFQIPLTLSTSPNAADPTCPILTLHIPQGIHLSLLGLNVDTSGICLNVTGESAPGNLLGNLVCGLSNALNTGPNGLSTFLGSLSASDLNTLLGGLSGILGGGLSTATTASLTSATGATPGVTEPNCNILHLSLGPVNLNLLGLNVSLDNCAGGPITVSVTATPGAGNLLGNLLCSLAHLLDSSANLTALENSLNRIAGQILSEI